MLTGRVGANDLKVAGAAEVHVAGAGRQDKAVTGLDLDDRAVRPTDQQACIARAKTPLGRPGQPAELASIYVQLADNGASFATGQVYGAAGGSGQP